MSFWSKVFWACDPLNTITRQLLKTRYLTEMYMLCFHFKPWFKFYYHTLPYPKTKQINFKPRIKLNHDIYTWARNTVMWHWSAYTLFWQLSIDHNMDVQLIKLSIRSADDFGWQKFLGCIDNHFFLTMVLRACASSAIIISLKVSCTKMAIGNFHKRFTGSFHSEPKCSLRPFFKFTHVQAIDPLTIQ